MRKRSAIASCRAIALVAGLAILVAAGCTTSKRASPATATGQNVVRVEDATGAALADGSVLDLGDVLVGARAQGGFALHNLGSGTVLFDGASLTGGDAPFALSPSEGGLAIGPGERRRFIVLFSPMTAGDALTRVTLNLVGAEHGTVSLQLKGEGFATCALVDASPVDFGMASVGGVGTEYLELRNGTSAPKAITLGAIESATPGVFSVSVASRTGDYVVPARSGASGAPGVLSIVLTFQPPSEGFFRGTLTLPAPQGCAKGNEVELKGRGVDRALVCDPAVDVEGHAVCRIDFGVVSPGATAYGSIGLRNYGNAPTLVRLVSITQPSESASAFALEGLALGDVVALQPQAWAGIAVAYRPSAAVREIGWLNYTAVGPAQVDGAIQLIGAGAGPHIDVAPGLIDFGQVATGGLVARRLTISNIGEEVVGTSDDNLKLAARASSGEWVEQRAEIVGADAQDFALDWPPAGYTEGGIAPGDECELRVTVAPTAAGPKSATLRIYSDDEAAPVLELPLLARASDLPTCDLQVTPATAVDFGAVEVSRLVTRTLELRNRSPVPDEICVVSGLDLTRETRALEQFRLRDGPIDSLTLRGGEANSIAVEVRGASAGEFESGEVELYVNDPQHPRLSVALRADATRGCISVAPAGLDFGAVGLGCTRIAGFALSSLCGHDFPVSAIGFSALAASQAGFHFARVPARPALLRSGTPMAVSVAFAPGLVGNYPGEVQVVLGDAGGGGSDATYVVPIRARAEPNPVQTDVFGGSDREKADLLLIVDDSPAMADQQASLARNAASIAHWYATVATGMDLHVAVTTTSVGRPGDANGQFLPLTGSAPRVLSNRSPGFEDALTQRLMVGTSGNPAPQLIRPAYLALSPGLLEGENGGFLRDDAQLVVVVISNGSDDSDPTPLSTYEAFFITVKGGGSRERWSVLYSAIIPTMSAPPGPELGCSYAQVDAGQSPRARQLVLRLGGILDDICDPDWSRTIEWAPTNCWGGPAGVLRLSRSPDLTGPKPLRVAVNGVEFPQYGSKGDKRWDYESGINSVVFDPLAYPDPDEITTVTYRVGCGE